MPKLLQINSVINSGSTGRIAEEIGILAIESEWDSFIAYGRNNRFSQSNKLKIGTEWDIKWHGIQTRLFDQHGLASKNATKELVNKIKEIEPDIIHLHNLHGYYLNIEVLFSYLALANISVVWTLHDCWPITGHCAYFTFLGCEKWRTCCQGCPQKRDYPSSLFFDRSKKNYLEKKKLFNSLKNLTIVPVSNWLSDIVKQSYLSEYPLRVIYNGIDTEVFSPKDTDAVSEFYNLQNKFVILGVATVWGERKGFNDFVELSKSLAGNEVIILIGLKETQIKKLPYNVIGLARTENTQHLAELYSLADVFLNPTWDDNFPTTNIEALSCGTPVITYRTGGSPEAISDETGFIINQGDIKGARNAIDEIKQRGKSYYSNACRERALKLYDKKYRFAEYIELYNKLLQ